MSLKNETWVQAALTKIMLALAIRRSAPEFNRMKTPHTLEFYIRRTYIVYKLYIHATRTQYLGECSPIMVSHIYRTRSWKLEASWMAIRIWVVPACSRRNTGGKAVRIEMQSSTISSPLDVSPRIDPTAHPSQCIGSLQIITTSKHVYGKLGQFDKNKEDIPTIDNLTYVKIPKIASLSRVLFGRMWNQGLRNFVSHYTELPFHFDLPAIKALGITTYRVCQAIGESDDETNCWEPYIHKASKRPTVKHFSCHIDSIYRYPEREF